MKKRHTIVTLVWAACAVACSQQADQLPSATPPATMAETDVAAIESIDIAPGLSARILKAGEGKVAQSGDNVVVHYTGWLYDASASDNRGDKFDSSVDRGEHFQFPLGAGRVIKGWDQGVVGMAIGEVRELTIASEMAYGERGQGSVIPPGATLVFEVELFGTASLSE